jgi:hypothetical protein
MYTSLFLVTCLCSIIKNGQNGAEPVFVALQRCDHDIVLVKTSNIF